MANNENDKILKDAQFRKGLSIAYFNSLNSAIEMVKLESTQKILTNKKGKKQKIKVDSLDGRVEYWKKVFIENHKNYYAKVIAQVGTDYDPKESIAKLEATKTLEDLQFVWRSLSAKERKDGDIIKVAQKLRKTYDEKI